MTPWRIAIDAGGTFTDCLGVDPLGRTHVRKVLSSGAIRGRALRVADNRVRTPCMGDLRGARGMTLRSGGRTWTIRDVEGEDLVLDASVDGWTGTGEEIEIVSGEEAPLLGVRLLTGRGPGEALPAMSLRLATTRATNALLEGAYPRVALFVTRGFRDLLRIGDQRRDDLFAIRAGRSRAITECVFEASGRLDAQGREIERPDPEQWQGGARRARAAGCEIAAIALMHAWRNDSHERALEGVLREAGFAVVVRGSDVAGRIGLLARAQTACVEAALSPVLAGYLASIERAIAPSSGGSSHVMTSAGGLCAMGAMRACDALLSGPAGGVIGAGDAGRRAGGDRVISFDMGGTSTDVARIDGSGERVDRHAVGGVTLLRPALAIETVAAGGGSICAIADGRLRVGPESAGAEPGPACYGRGGPLTLTDVNLLLGRIDPARFQVPLDVDAARLRSREILRAAREAVDGSMDEEGLLVGFLRIADERMGEAIGRISVRRGYDPAEHALVAFGGAGGQHACAIAQRLGVRRVVLPGLASVLSAAGVASARIEREASAQILRTLHEGWSDALAAVESIETRLIEEIAREEGIPSAQLGWQREAMLRWAGQESTLGVEIAGGADDVVDAFRARWRALYGQDAELERDVEIESVRVVARAFPEGSEQPGGREGGQRSVRRGEGVARVHDGIAWVEASCHERERMREGERVEGPALIVGNMTSVWVAQGWSGAVREDGTIVLEREERASDARFGGDAAVRSSDETLARELIVHRLGALAESMGEALRRLSISTNVKERLDYSCGVLDAQGRLVASAPHIPVHLGALGACVRRVVEELGAFRAGDIAVTNHPAFGGSHLPDVTLVQGAFDDHGSLIGYVASRAHHAEIGGIAPGSMPAGATCLAEEGVVIPPMFLVRDKDGSGWGRVRDLLTRSPHPSRAIGDNLADLRGALAAGRLACDELGRLAANVGKERVARSMDWIRAHTAGLVRAAVESIGPREGIATLDDGATIRVRLGRERGVFVLDFSQTSAQRGDNLNAPLAVTRSAVAYVLRLLIGREIPLNDGLLEAVEIRVPEGSMLHPVFGRDPSACPAVAAGNVEVSQLVVEALLDALGIAGDSQGTMNNLLLGNSAFGYYETIGGGCGAGEGFDGASGVHSHMTNTAITDAEIMEQRYPLRIERHAIREGSRGAGRFRGGDGVVRTIRALTDLRATIIAQHRVRPPRGRMGGGDGRVGAQRVIDALGGTRELRGSDSVRLRAGEAIEIETPGGGGWGRAE